MSAAHTHLDKSGLVHPPRARLEALTGIRFFAAFHVLLFHTLEWPGWAPGPGRSFLGMGGIAVSLFFVLSGFILAYTYAGRGGVAASPRAFYAARFSRIYPVYAFGLLLSAPLFVLSHVEAHKLTTMVPKAVASIFLVQAYVPKLALVWNAPGWSLSDEALFYALFPLIAPPLLRIGAKGTRVLFVVAWLVGLALPIGYLVLRPDGAIPIETWTRATFVDLVRYNPIARVPEFVMGILAGHMYIDRARDGKRSLGIPYPAEVTIVAILLAYAFAPSSAYLVLHNAGLAPVFAFLILALAQGDGPLVRFLASAPLVVLGEASYALYIVHEPIANIVKYLAEGRAPTWPGSVTFMLVVAVLSIGCSIFTFRAIELPLRDRLRNLLAPKTPKTAPVATSAGAGS